MKKVILKKGRERSLLRKHPWVFSGAVYRADKSISSGETVAVLSEAGQHLGWGSWSSQSQIRVRMWSFNHADNIDESFFMGRIQNSVLHPKRTQLTKYTNAMRLVCSEADYLPGLIADIYNDVLVCQFLSAGAVHWKSVFLKCIQEVTGVKRIYERSDSNIRKKEGLNCFQAPLKGEFSDEPVTINEHGIDFLVDVVNGHKTGFYLDQRDNRLVLQQSSSQADVLNCFAYTGGFGLSALKGGARHVVNIEDNAGLVELIGRQCQLNGFDESRYTNLKGDVFQLLRNFEKEGRTFDIIILDPPKFAESQSQLLKAARGYKDINLNAFKLLRPGGKLFTFSCSGLMKADFFQKVIADAAIDSGRSVNIDRFLMQSGDHPVKIEIPETLYLKGLLATISV